MVSVHSLYPVPMVHANNMIPKADLDGTSTIDILVKFLSSLQWAPTSVKLIELFYLLYDCERTFITLRPCVAPDAVDRNVVSKSVSGSFVSSL